MALKLVITPAARLGLSWFRIYYLDYFPEGMLKANQRFEKICRLLCERPLMGRRAGRGECRFFIVPDTPYTIIYREREEFLEILNVLDQRKSTYLQDIFDT